jgi:hypothetical protein
LLKFWLSITANLLAEGINTLILHVGSTHRDFSFEGERIPFNGGYFWWCHQEKGVLSDNTILVTLIDF